MYVNYLPSVVAKQVWDYVGDGYVHRLLYHKGEGQVSALSLVGPTAPGQ